MNLPATPLLAARIGGNGDWLSPGRHAVLSWRQELDMERGIATRGAPYADAAGRRLRLREERLVSMARPNLVALRLHLTAENWSGRLDLRDAIDGRVKNGNTDHELLDGYRHLDVTGVDAPNDEILLMTARTRQSGIAPAVATRTSTDARRGRASSHGDAAVLTVDMAVDVAEGRALVVETLAVVVTERDPAVADPDATVPDAVRRTTRAGLVALRRHRAQRRGGPPATGWRTDEPGRPRRRNFFLRSRPSTDGRSAGDGVFRMARPASPRYSSARHPFQCLGYVVREAGTSASGS